MNNATTTEVPTISVVFSGATDYNKFDALFHFESTQINAVAVLDNLINLLADQGLIHRFLSRHPFIRLEVVVPRRDTPEDTQTAFGEQYKQILQDAIELAKTSVTTAFSVIFLNSEQEEMSSLIFSKEGEHDRERAEFVQWLYGAERDFTIKKEAAILVISLVHHDISPYLLSRELLEDWGTANGWDWAYDDDDDDDDYDLTAESSWDHFPAVITENPFGGN